MSNEQNDAGSEEMRTERGPESRATERDGRAADETRRALIRAGWVVPAVLAVKLPATAFAQYAHGDSHTDGVHSDVHTDLFSDVHSDAFVDAHSDHIDHIDVPHSDTHSDHVDLPHVDLPHSDHVDHSDGVHVDI